MATRHAICTLSAAGQSNNEIVRTLKVAKTIVIRTLKKQAAGGFEHDTTRRKKTVLTLRVAAGLRRRIKSAPTKSLRRVAKEAGLKPAVVWKLVRNEGWRSLRRKKVPLISSAGRKKCAARAAGLLNALKEGGNPGRIIFFSDEKTFVVDPAFNPQNDRYIEFYSDSEEDETAGDEAEDGDRRRSGRYMARSKHPAGAMFLGAVASTGETSPPIWFPEGFRLGPMGILRP